MIRIEDKKECVGCGACYGACPVHAIEMKADKEGFFYPIVNENSCIQCNLCEKICPVKTNALKENTPIADAFALKNSDEKIREKSSSGGVFFELSNFILNHGGCVYGVAFDENFLTQHIFVQDKEDIPRIMGSKYLQSPGFNCFAEIKQRLKNDEKVLFSGTPCQISGLKAFLRSDYDNLYCVEICCHAVPSPKAWLMYLKQFSNLNVDSISFRSKSFGWNHYGLLIKNVDGNVIVDEPKEKNLYMRGFLSSLFDRPSCSKCPQKPFKSSADAVIGDFWGVDIQNSDFNDNKGVSLFIPLTKKGAELFSAVKECFVYRGIDVNDILTANGNFNAPETEHRNRDLFWKLVNEKNVSFDVAVQKCLKEKITSRIKRKIRKFVSK